MENDEWRMERGEWRIENGEWCLDKVCKTSAGAASTLYFTEKSQPLEETSPRAFECLRQFPESETFPRAQRFLKQ